MFPDVQFLAVSVALSSTTEISLAIVIQSGIEAKQNKTVEQDANLMFLQSNMNITL